MIESTDPKLKADARTVLGPTLHQAFSAQATRTPDAIAVTDGDRHITYRELDAQSDQLARRLIKIGVGPESLVGMAVDRSAELVVAILGILKAGGAYLPLDCAYPKPRLGMILDDARVTAVVTQTKLLEQLPELTTPSVCLDQGDVLEADVSPGELPKLASPLSAAYVIYTSGSTGIPKGVVVTHHNAIRLFTATDHWYGFGHNDVWTLFHSAAFDFSVWELWGALLYGGRLVIVSWDVSRSPADFHALLRRERVTVLNQTPSAFRPLIQVDATRTTADELALRYVIFGGEALELHTLKPWFQRHGDRKPQLVNMYGITETTVHVTYRPISLQDVNEQHGSVIGVPIPDLEIYVLDEQQQPVGIGEVGEIVVGGAGVARGYLNRPELTAERFIRHPFDAGVTEPLYRSGDLARRLPDGDIEYLGRIDHQVKINGFRIELGEIEASLSQHANVRENVVVARDDQSGEKRLVAYVVPKRLPKPSSTELRRHLQGTLPAHMVPTAYIALEELPLTINGKLDRAALPAPTRQSAGDERALVAPRNETETVLVALWEEVLGVQPIGIDDDFFELGGHSLTAMRLISLIEERTGQRVSMASIFRASTVSLLCELLSESEEAHRIEPVIAFRAQGTRPPLFFFPLIDGFSFYPTPLVEYLSDDQPVYSLQPASLDGHTPPHDTIEAMANSYIEELRRVQPTGPYYLCGYCYSGITAFEVACQLTREGETVAMLALIDSIVPGAAKRQPLRRRLLGHLRKMRELSITDSLTYFYQRWQGLWRRMFGGSEELFGYRAPEGASASIAETLTNIVRAGEHALAAYVPQTFPGRITLIQADRTEEGDFVEVEPLDGWGPLAGQGLEIIQLKCGHTDFFEGAHAQQLAEQIASCALAAQGGSTADERSVSIDSHSAWQSPALQTR